MKFKLRKLQIARRSVQIFIFALMLVIPVVSRYGNYLAARELDKNLEKWEGTLQGETLQATDIIFRALPGGEKEVLDEIRRDRKQVLVYTQSLRGGPWSAKIGPLSMSDPLAAAESIVASKQINKVLLISLIIPIIATVLLGRIFCSWICPVGLLMEVSDKIRNLLKFLELQPRNVRFSRWAKYTLLGVGLALAGFLSVPILGYIYPPAIMGREAHDFIFGLFDRAEIGKFGWWFGGLTWMSLILLGIVLFEVLVSQRWWCRYVCPGGALYGLLGWARPVRVKLIVPACTNCAECVKVCPVGLNPMRNEMGIDCDSCGVCISHCDDKALAYALQLKPEARETNLNAGIKHEVV